MQTIKGVKVTNAQADVYAVIKEFSPPGGMPDHALVPLAQHAANVRQSSSGIRTRREELYRKGLLYLGTKSYTTASGRKARAFEV